MTLEVIAAIGLILPTALNTAPMFVTWPISAWPLLMIGAIVTHARGKEPQMISEYAVLRILAARVAGGRFGP